MTLGVCVAAGANSASAASSNRNRVLGQPARTPTVIGQPAPTGTGQLDAVSCADAEHCWAVGSPGSGPAPTAAAGTGTSTSVPATLALVIDATTDGGRSWAGEPLALPSTPALEGISCPSDNLCMTVGLNDSASAGVVLTTHDAGATWDEVPPPAGAIVVSSVACPSATDCTVIASDGTTFWSARSTDFGRTWEREGDLPAGLQDAGGLSCLGGTLCLVNGFTATTTGHGQGAIVLSIDSGATWTAADVPAGTGLLQSAICITFTSCLAAGTTSTTVSAVVPAKGAVLESDDGGQTWTRTSRSNSIDDVYGVDCPSPRVCVMVGTKWIGTPPVGTGAVSQRHDGKTAFTASTTAYTPLPLTALACPSVRTCIAVGGDTLARIALGSGGGGGETGTGTSPGRGRPPSSTTVRPTHLPSHTGRL